MQAIALEQHIEGLKSGDDCGLLLEDNCSLIRFQL
jgi:hypothetical protein